jgi:hypothetical protein
MLGHYVLLSVFMHFHDVTDAFFTEHHLARKHEVASVLKQQLYVDYVPITI